MGDQHGEVDDVAPSQRPGTRVDPAFERSPIGVVHVRADGTLLRVNDRICELLGYEREELLGLSSLELSHPDDSDATTATFEAAVATDQLLSLEKRFVCRDGALVHARVSLSPVHRRDGSLDHVLAHVIDRTAEVEAHEAARQAAERFETLLATAADVVVVLDEDRTVRFVSNNVVEVLGWDTDQIVDRHFHDIVHSRDVSTFRETFAHVVRTGEPVAATYRVRHGDGRWRWVEARCVDRRREEVIGGIVANLRDITERVEMEHALRHQALHDAVTGLPNRALLSDRMMTAIDRSARAGRTFAVLFLDLDHFKHTNDTLGHEVGDRLLVAVADRLRSSLRAGDTLARVGGDEFVMLLELLRGSDAHITATRLATELLADLARPITIAGHQLSVRASIGIAIHTPDREAQDLLRDADVAMYAAKGQGRSRVAVHDQSMRAAMVARFAMDGVIRRALTEDGVAVEFQPIVDLSTQRIVGAEALARLEVDGMRHQPDTFIDAAEDAGTIVALGNRVLDTALDRARHWPADVYVAINLSARQLATDDVAGWILRRAQANSVAPDRLVLEVTESALVASTDRIDATMVTLANAGVRIALDDFGTGFSSLSYLRRFPVSMVKIDRSFVAGVSRIGSGDVEVIRAVVGLAGALGIEVVAEGIENSIQAAVLSELGCSLGQGFLYGHPTPHLQVSRTEVGLPG